MPTPSTVQPPSKRGEVIVAVIGLIGVLATGVLSNWDKLFHPQTVVEAKATGYAPTGDFATELRYYFDVSGTRQMMETMQRQLLLNTKADLLSKYPGEAQQIASVFNAAEREAPSVDDVIREMMPVYQKHYSLAEIQELNKFYSTAVMRNMVNKAPQVAQDAAPIQMKIMNEYLERLDNHLKGIVPSK